MSKILTATPRAGAASAAPAFSQHRSPRAALLWLLLLLCALMVVPLNTAWRETVQREAYLPQLEAQARQTPDDGPLQALLGGRLAEAGEYSVARDAFKRSLAAGEKSEALWLNLAAATAASGDSPRARADLRIAQAASPHSAELEAAAARLTALSSEVPAVEVAAAICPQGPGPLLAAYTAGSFFNRPISWWGRRHAENSGFATRQEWVSQRPDDPQALRLWGLALMENRRLPEAGLVLQRAVRYAPRSPAALLALADWLDRVGQPAKASLQYLQCLQRKPDWLPALLGYGRALSQLGLAKRTGSSYQKATKIAPDSVEAWVGLAHAYQATGADYDKASQSYQTASRLVPHQTDFFNDWSVALQQIGHWGEAESLLRRRLQATPDDPFTHYLLGKLLSDSNPTPARELEAEAQIRAALRLLPHSYQSEVQLAQLLLRHRRTQEALNLLTDAVLRNPYDDNTLRILARTYQALGQQKQSADAAHRANSLFHDQQAAAVLQEQEGKNFLNVDIHSRLAEMYERTGQPELARQERSMVHLLRTNPAEAARSQQQYEATIKSAIDSH